MPRNTAEAKAIAAIADAYVFRPTKKQKEWLQFFKTRGAGLTVNQSARACGIDPKTFWKWKIQPGFGQWVYDHVVSDRGLDFAEVHALAMERFRRGGREGASYFKTIYPNLGEATGAFKKKLEVDLNLREREVEDMSEAEKRELLRKLVEEHG